jgi:hypothetical protein
VVNSGEQLILKGAGLSGRSLNIMIGGARCDPINHETQELYVIEAGKNTWDEAHCKISGVGLNVGLYTVSFSTQTDQRGDAIAMPGSFHIHPEFDEKLAAVQRERIFHMEVPPRITAFTPSSASVYGGFALTILGVGFSQQASEMEILVGGTPCTIPKSKPGSSTAAADDGACKDPLIHCAVLLRSIKDALQGPYAEYWFEDFCSGTTAKVCPKACSTQCHAEKEVPTELTPEATTTASAHNTSQSKIVCVVAQRDYTANHCEKNFCVGARGVDYRQFHSPWWDLPNFDSPSVQRVLRSMMSPQNVPDRSRLD